jgi:hypothetical protein
MAVPGAARGALTIAGRGTSLVQRPATALHSSAKGSLRLPNFSPKGRSKRMAVSRAAAATAFIAAYLTSRYAKEER